MKKLLFIFGILLSLSSFAQKAHFNSKESKQRLNENQVQFKFFVTEIATEAQAQAIADKMKASKAIVSINRSGFSNGKVDFIVITMKQENLLTIQNAMIAANINNFELDGASYKTTVFRDTVREKVKREKK